MIQSSISPRSAWPRFRQTTLAFVVLASAVNAANVTISFVTDKDGKSAPLEKLQSLWKSPFRGWVVTTWPFGLKVGDTAILEYQSAFGKLLDQAGAGRSGAAVLPEGLADDLLESEKPIEVSDLMSFKFDRPSAAEIRLPPGEHAILPWKLPFTVNENNTVVARDPRLRVADNGRCLEVICHRVTLRAMADGRSVSFPTCITYGNVDLLGGLTEPIEEFESKAMAGQGESEGKKGYRRVTLYLPASSADLPYAVNGATFHVSSAGRLAADDAARLRVVGEAELQVLLPSPGRIAAPHHVGIRWVRSPGGMAASAGGVSVQSAREAGSVFLPISAAAQGNVAVALGPQKASPVIQAPVPPTFEEWPYKTLVFDGAGSGCWLMEMSQLSVKPGDEFRCRVSPATMKTQGMGERLAVALKPVESTAAVVIPSFNLAAKGYDVYAGSLPTGLAAGLRWLEGGAGSPLAGVTLGLVYVAAAEPAGSLSFYAYRNRGLFRRGDGVDLFWALKGGPGGVAQGVPVVLKGRGISRELTRIQSGRPDVSGYLRIDTEALAPGDYEIGTQADGLVCYPARLRVVQREPVSDYALYSYVFGPVRPSGAVPGIIYYDSNPAGEPGLQPLIREIPAGLDPALAAYASAPAGPALDACAMSSEAETAVMALAAIGSSAVLGMPRMIHHEDWNPKHSLPEELSELRRRLALFAQQYVDVSGFDGIALNWYATLGGYWEESPALDGHQAARNAAANKWIAEMADKREKEARKTTTDTNALAAIRNQAALEYRSSVLPNAYGHYLADAKVIRPGLTSHSGIPSFWLGGGQSYPPTAYTTLSHRDAVDYTDYGISPWGNFRAPAFLGMGNPEGQKTRCCFMTAGRHSRIVTAFGAAGRGLDGLSMSFENSYCTGEDGALLRIFQRFGSYFTALDPLPDVAVYYSAMNAWANQKSVILHDLARLRRPGVLLSPDDVLAGKLKNHRVLFLAATTDLEPKPILDAFKAFEAAGGFIVKDGYCSASLPGRKIEGFLYDDKQVHSGWGLAWPDGEWEFAHLWMNFLETREKPLMEALAKAPLLPVGTPTHDILVSPLGGSESICCFVVNQTYVPMSVEGKWRQHAVLPGRSTLRVPDGWYVRDLLRGKPCVVQPGPDGPSVALDFTRAEGNILVLMKREPKGMVMKTERRGTATIRLSAWLEDSAKKPLTDPLPFEVSLTGSGSAVVFHKYAALSPTLTLEVPVPALAAGTSLDLTLHDLVAGYRVTQKVEAAPPDAIAEPASADVIGADQVRAFLTARKGPVAVLLDEGQQAYRSAAGKMIDLLRRQGREASIVTYDPTEVRLLPLRWRWLDEDISILDAVTNRNGIAWRVNLSAWAGMKRKQKTVDFDVPACGYSEYGPRTRFERDVVLFGSTTDHLALKDLEPYLRRSVSENYPSAGRFFVHYLWDPFQGGSDGLYLGCRDVAGAEAAVAFLTQLPPARQAESVKSPTPVITSVTAVAPLDDLLTGSFGTLVLDVAYAPSGNRLFVTADSYGDSLFVLDPAGTIASSRPLSNRCGNNIWSRNGGGLRSVDDESLHVKLWGSEYLLNLQKGFISYASSPHHGIPGRFQVNVAGSTLYKDAQRGRTYVGGARRVSALDAQGRLLWAFDDTFVRTSTADMLAPRGMFIRGISPDGRRVLVSGFGIQQDCYGIGSIVNESVFCLDASSGNLLWARDGLLLNEGKVIPSDGRFIIVDDAGRFHVLDAESGKPKGALRPVGGTDWIIPLPGGDRLLVVENNHFDRAGPSAWAYLRSFGDAPDVALDVAGRVMDAVLAQDGKAIFLATERGRTACFSLDGRREWESDTPAGGVVRPSPDGKTVAVGTREGRVLFLDRQTGNLRQTVDLNPFNVTTGERFIKQLGSLGDVPQEKSVVLPPAAPAPSYLKSLRADSVKLGPNLVPVAAVIGALKKTTLPGGDPAAAGYLVLLDKPTTFSLDVEAKQTYLIEWLAMAVDPAKLTPQTRVEITVSGKGKTANLPYVARLPLDRHLTRRRAAFRADEAGPVTITLRAVKPHTEGEGQKAKTSYAVPDPADTAAVLGDLVVASLNFASPNLVLDQGPAARSNPRGSLNCEVKPWTGGNSTLRHTPYPAPAQALRMVDGVIANQETAWTMEKEARGADIDYATGVVRFQKPQTVSAVAVYEDNSGPIPVGQGFQEKTAMHFGVYVHETKKKTWTRVGYVLNNTDLVNVFTFPPIEVDEIKYFWAGRDFADRTDGIVRSAELEVYSTEDISLLLDTREGPATDDLKLDL